jgi:HAD superfamily hydrolase (TIGR01509 family)
VKKYKGVFFDWFNTLAGYETPRESLYQKAFKQYGIELNTRTIYKGIQRGDRYYFSKGAPLMNTANTLEANARYYHLYPQYIADEAHLEISSEIQLAVVQKALSEFNNKMVLFDDCLPVIRTLKQNHLFVGIITNADARVLKMIENSGIAELVDVVTTSEEAKSEKPDAVIFRLALSKVNLKASEAVFVGDQYQNDVVGAVGAGLSAILLDRNDALPDGNDYVRVQSLTEVLIQVNN